MEEKREKNTSQEKAKGVRMNPKIYLIACIIFLALIILMGILTRVLPQGAYERELIDGHEHVIAGTYHEFDEQTVLPIWRWFTAPAEVLASPLGVTILAVTLLLMVIGGAYTVFEKSGLIQRFLAFMVRKFGNRKYLMLSGVMVIFILIGSTFGTVEGTIAVVPLTVALAIAMGWDSLVGVAIVFVAEIRGLAAGTTNPFTIVLTQTLAGVPVYSGMWLRILILIFTIVVMLAWIIPYARKIEKDPKRSLMYEADLLRKHTYSMDALMHVEKKKYPFTARLLDFAKSAVTFAPMIVIGALIMSLSHILTEGRVIDTLISRMALLVSGTSAVRAALMMLVLTLFVELFLPGTYVKACLLFPILLPLGDIAGLSRLLVAQTFILGDTFANMFFPTDVMLMMTLGLIGCGYGKWVRWCGLFVAVMMAFCAIVVALCARFGYA